jgi:HAE1 family hydrophobic/amphiphilic exporter-1
MNLSELFIRRPVATTLIMVAAVFFGIMGYRQLPVSDLPSVDFPTLSVSAGLPGASPETMASAVATPLEKQFATIAGVTSITSSNSQGSTNITLQFALDRDIDAASQDVQAMISRTLRSLPQGMPTPPSFRKVNPADSPILFLTASSKTLPLATVDEYAENTVGQRISMVSGVAQVQVFGAQKYAVRILMDPMALAARKIGVDAVASAIAKWNVNQPAGVLNGAKEAFVIQSNGQLNDADAYRPLVVAWRNGTPVRLGEVAQILDSVENDKTATWQDGARTIFLAIQRQPGTNTVEVVDNIRKLLPVFQAELPPSVHLEVFHDRSQSIRDSVNDVKFTLLLTVCLVVLVIFLFLRNVPATIIPSLALPTSIVGTFAVMYQLGYSLDNLSLMALTLSVGFVVDDAIVMLENIVRHLELGEKPFDAALSGSREISFTILSMTLSLAAVFIPVLFMGGIVGRLLHEFAVTIGAAILVSGAVSLTLTPMLCSRFLRNPADVRHGRMYRASEKVFDGALRFYNVTLRRTLRHPNLTVAVLVLLVAGTGYLFVVVPTGFIPSEDIGVISGSTLAVQGIGFDAMVAHQQEAAAIIGADPNVETFTSTVNGGNTGRFSIHLKPRNARALSANQIIDELRPKLAKIAGLQVFLTNPPAIQVGGRMASSNYQYTLQGPDTDALFALAPVMQQKIAQIPGIMDVTSDLQIKNPQVQINVDRDRAAALGLTFSDVATALGNAYATQQVSMIYTPTNEYEVILGVEPQYQDDPAALSRLYIRAPSGALIPLSTLATVERTVGPLSVNHTGQLPSVTISFNLVNGMALGDAVAKVQQVAQATLPATVSGSFQGTAQAFQDSFAGLGLMLVLAVAVIYVVLGILYESFIHPLTILSGLPAAGFGALITLLIFHQELNLYSFVGVIMLVGLVKKNGIMMIDFALEAQRKEFKAPIEAIHEACMVRFRPIMMTTMAALAGTLPIALGFGAGAESRRPLGLAVVGGLVVSQLLTLYITPSFYVWMEGMRGSLRRVHVPHRRTAEDALPEGVITRSETRA